MGLTFLVHPVQCADVYVGVKQIDELGKQWRFDNDDIDEPETKCDDVTRGVASLVGSSSGVESCTASERLETSEDGSPPSPAVVDPQPPLTTATPPAIDGVTSATDDVRPATELPQALSPDCRSTVHPCSTTEDCLPPPPPPTFELDSIIAQLVTSQQDDDVTGNADATTGVLRVCLSLTTFTGVTRQRTSPTRLYPLGIDRLTPN